jgi:HlyD family secretion protein
MNTTINFIETDKENILLLPVEAVYTDKEENFVLIRKDGFGQPVRQTVKLGISDDKNIEIVSGVREKDIVVLRNKKFVLPKSDVGSSPFTPFGQRKDTGKKK